MAQFNRILFLDLDRFVIAMCYWKKRCIPTLLVVASCLSSILPAHYCPYFEELDRIEIPNNIAMTHFKVTPDGCKLLVIHYTDDAKTGFVNIYKLQLHEGQVGKVPVSSIRYDGLNNPFAAPSTIGVIDDDKGTKIYIYSFAKQANDIVMPMVSGYRINSDGLPTVIDHGYVVLPDKGFPLSVGLYGAKALEIQKDIILALTSKGVAVIKINTDGSLNYSGKFLPLSNKKDQLGLPATLLYIPSLHQLFLGLNCEPIPLNNQVLCKEESTFLSIYSFSKDDHFNNVSLHEVRFDNNASYPMVMTALSQSHGARPIVSGHVLGGSFNNSPDCKTMPENQETNWIVMVNPVTLQIIKNNVNFCVSDIEFSAADDRIYFSSFVTGQADYGLVAYDIASNLSIQPLFDSKLKTEFDHYALELMPDSCHLLASAGCQCGSLQTGYLILYRINDEKLNCTVPSSTTSLKLIISIPVTVLVITGLTLATILICYLARKYSARKGYSPIND